MLEIMTMMVIVTVIYKNKLHFDDSMSSFSKSKYVFKLIIYM